MIPPGEGSRPRLIGLISDTHGMVRSGVHAAFAGVELILHAGDVGGDAVLDELQTIAPVLAVFGNTDAPDDPRLEREVVRELGGVTVHVSHGHELGSPVSGALLAAYPQDILVYGHTHRALVIRAATDEGGTRLVVNPGAAGPQRFRLAPSVARLTVANGEAQVEIVEIGG